MTALGRVLVANRGEVAVRVLAAARERGLATVAVHAADEADAPHVRLADAAVPLERSGPAAYLDVDALVRAATSTGATHVHPGYGFLSEDPGFARALAAAGVVLVGPRPEVLELLGDKVATREAALAEGVPVLAATSADASLDDVRALLRAHPDGVVVKAQSAGGGRGIRVVTDREALPAAYAACTAEARAASGREAVFAEERLAGARHVEVQVVGAPDGAGVRVRAVGDRDCSVQRAHQKVLELAPAPDLPDELRRRLHVASAVLCSSVGLTGLATVELLVSGDRWVLLEVNPRLQVEHTVTEAVTGLDLVGLQLAVAGGARFDQLHLPPGATARDGAVTDRTLAVAAGTAVQARVCAETVEPSGRVLPGSGTVSALALPTGHGVRVDTALRVGAAVSGRYDPLLAKVVVHVASPSRTAALDKAAAALRETVVAGVPTNLDLLLAAVTDEELLRGPVPADWLERALPRLLGDRVLSSPAPASVDGNAVTAEVLGTVVSVAGAGEVVPAGGELAVLEAMKMHHPVLAPTAVRVARVLCAVGDTVPAGTPLLLTEPATGGDADRVEEVPLDHVREDLAQVQDRHRRTLDAARGEALARLRSRGRRTARENLADLVDDGTFVEYGGLAVAAQRGRRSVEELVDRTPADGVVCGTASVNGALFDHGTEAVVLAYDYSVQAGTQGLVGHAKTDRVLEVAASRGLPVVLFAEGGGGRPNDTDRITTGLVERTFHSLAALSGRVPLVAVVSGYCFAGNAALAGTCDVVIATPDARLGMGGPAMVEGGGLGVVRPQDIGPVDVQAANGVVDVVAADEAEAVATARRYLSYFQGRTRDAQAPDPLLARHVVPEDRLRSYDVRAALAALVDVGSVLELRRAHGRGVVTALARFEGHPCGVLANDSRHLGGAIDAEAARKAAAFLRLCDRSGLPVLSLCDTPGFMVGPDAEREGGVRAFPDLFAAGARLSVPTGVVVLRKAYGLGAMAMAFGHLHAPLFTIAWPTGELGPMGLEGAVRLGAREQLEAESDPARRRELEAELVALAYEHGRALNAATLAELDDVVDPAETRRWVRQLFAGSPARGA